MLKNQQPVPLPSSGGVTRPSKPEEWFRVMELAVMWDLTKARDEAASALEGYISKAPLHERIAHGFRFRKGDWLRPALREAVVLSDVRRIPYKEIVQMGGTFEGVAKLLSVREMRLGSRAEFYREFRGPLHAAIRNPSICKNAKGCSNKTFVDAYPFNYSEPEFGRLDEEFKEEFADLELWDEVAFCSLECSKQVSSP
ncbi:hypothetical protein CVT24_010830 [Panaeolus cyanescens]|uniref:Uncharacterized protein n=1 Tax=Panaeolus cyanescens TaxID=181874 RepID=A0A409VH37_9AGAR|nr:hypothetical protein CVT24_010830 [Panaeolus cyanescens]